MHKSIAVFLLATFVAFAADARASTLTIVVGDHQLLPNTPHQPVPIFVTGGAQVNGMNFIVQVADGGPSNIFAGPGFISGPTITVDALTGTIWAANHNPVLDPTAGTAGNQTVWAAITTSSGTVAANGLVGTIYVDTTGWTLANEPLLNGVGPTKGWELNMGGQQGVQSPFLPAPSDFGIFQVGDGLNIIDGHISIIPEPSTLALAALGFAALVAWRWRRR